MKGSIWVASSVEQAAGCKVRFKVPATVRESATSNNDSTISALHTFCGLFSSGYGYNVNHGVSLLE